MVWIKICGITNWDDALAAFAAGADALGFVLAPGPRRVEPDTVRRIAMRLPREIEKIGVFVNEDLNTVKEIALYCGLTGLQLHGEEPAFYCRRLRELSDCCIIKSFSVRDRMDNVPAAPYLQEGCVDRILLDAYVPGKAGGTGKTFPWEGVPRQDWRGVPVIIAGGLNSGNALQAVLSARPFGLDVSSVVEKEPGRKDHLKLKEFIETGRGLGNG